VEKHRKWLTALRAARVAQRFATRIGDRHVCRYTCVARFPTLVSMAFDSALEKERESMAAFFAARIEQCRRRAYRSRALSHSDCGCSFGELVENVFKCLTPLALARIAKHLASEAERRIGLSMKRASARG
jgi:hypothetical protein